MGNDRSTENADAMTETRITAKPESPQVVITREFDAPRELLFRAHTEPELLRQWLGPHGYILTVDRLDLRDGGTWRYRHRDTDGGEHTFHGVYHGTPSVEGIVQTFEYDGMPGLVSLQTTTFEPRGGRTLQRQNVVYQSVEDRDAYVRSGMEHGVHISARRLDDLLADLLPGN